MRPEYQHVWLFWASAEELAFGFAFGMYWAGVYEHFTWKHAAAGGVRALFDASHRGQHG